MFALRLVVGPGRAPGQDQGGRGSGSGRSLRSRSLGGRGLGSLSFGLRGGLVGRGLFRGRLGGPRTAAPAEQPGAAHLAPGGLPQRLPAPLRKAAHAVLEEVGA